MSGELWPLWMGQYPLRESLRYDELGDDLVFTPEDGEGFEITGRRTGARVVEMAGEWPCDRAHYPAFLDWWDRTCDGGRTAFWLIDPARLEQRLWRRKPGTVLRTTRFLPSRVYVALELRSLPHA